MRTKGFFITGTDTGIGKTRVTLAIIQAYKARGMKVSGMKPVASGCIEKDGELKNEDALIIQSISSEPYSYKQINPYAFKEPIAPHFAAENAGTSIDIEKIVDAYNSLAEQNDIVIVEGAGGWRVPMSADFSTCDVVRALDIPVILVVGLRLGCINHALLTNQAIQSDNILLAGWVANCIDQDYQNVGKTVQTLARHITAPLLGKLSFLPICNTTAPAMDINIDLL